MEIHVNDVPVANVEGFIRTVAIRTESGEVTSINTAPGTRLINIVTEQKLPANAPRLDELEALAYLEAYERGDLSAKEGQDDEHTLAVQNTSRITSSDVDADNAGRPEGALLPSVKGPFSEAEVNPEKAEEEREEKAAEENSEPETETEPQKQDFTLGANS